MPQTHTQAFDLYFVNVLNKVVWLLFIKDAKTYLDCLRILAYCIARCKHSVRLCPIRLLLLSSTDRLIDRCTLCTIRVIYIYISIQNKRQHQLIFRSVQFTYVCVCVCTPADHGTSHTCHMNRIQKNRGVQMNVRRTTLYQRQLNESMISLQFIYAYCAYGNLFNRSITSNQYKYSIYILCIHSVSDDTEVDMCINMKPTRLYHIIHNGHGQ